MSLHRAFVALGSNMGDRARHIRCALRRMESFAQVSATSFLYESAPMYYTAQAPFFNAVAEVRTPLAPLDLLHQLKSVEAALGREASTVRNAPRPIDLDIVLYDADAYAAPDATLTVPHPRMHERDFVLRPLCDIDEDVVVPPAQPGHPATANQLLRALNPALVDSFRCDQSGLARVLPLRTSRRAYLAWGPRPKLMGIINTTPDSFSDGGKYGSIPDILLQVERFVGRGFDFVDVGGYSTRPGAAFVSPEEELSRVVSGTKVPAISAIRNEFPEIAISVDTFRTEIAAAALDAGADLVNDVSAGAMDPAMASHVRRSGCSWTMMHMRGTPHTMQEPRNTDYSPRGVTRVVAEELSASVEKALSVGVPRWDVIVDPGIGFAKKAEQSVELVRSLREWKKRMRHFPCLVGQSRKSSLVHLVNALKHEPMENRDFASSGAAIAAMLAGADVLRVHNHLVADAISVACELASDSTSSGRRETACNGHALSDEVRESV